uniref:Uncharacterized protein n=1 Tax=Cyprinus carpio TaxID=7962 RepID=A0A8C1NRV6_CYPCA
RTMLYFSLFHFSILYIYICLFLYLFSVEFEFCLVIVVLVVQTREPRDEVLLGDERGFTLEHQSALLGRPVQTREPRDKVLLGDERGFTLEQPLQTVPLAVCRAHHPLVLQRV